MLWVPCSKAARLSVTACAKGSRDFPEFARWTVGQYRTNRLLLDQVSDEGRPKVVSKVGVSRETSLNKSNKTSHENLSGVLARCFFDFCWTASYETLTFGSLFTKIYKRTPFFKIQARRRPCAPSTLTWKPQNNVFLTNEP